MISVPKCLTSDLNNLSPAEIAFFSISKTSLVLGLITFLAVKRPTILSFPSLSCQGNRRIQWFYSSHSPFEKYIYAYNITKRFKEYKENDEDRTKARNIYDILFNEVISKVLKKS